MSVGSTVHIAVIYDCTQQYGSLRVTITGLPNGVAADVSVAGQNSYQAMPTATVTYNQLLVGPYTVTARPVTTGTQACTPNPPTQSVTVSASGPTAQASVTYTCTTVTGGLRVGVSGLPTGVAAAITVSGPGGYQTTVIDDVSLTVPVGPYTISAAPVSTTTQVCVPLTVTQQQVVTASVVSPVSVTYSCSTSKGTLDVAVSGLPAGTAAAITVTGPNGYQQMVTASAPLSVPVGTYVIAAAPVSTATQLCTPAPTSQQRTISANAIAGGASCSWPAGVE